MAESIEPLRELGSTGGEELFPINWNTVFKIRHLRSLATVASLFFIPALGHAQTLTTLYTFSGTQGFGTTQGALVQGADGLFYGATSTGGPHSDGTIFKITPTGVLTTLYSFSGTDGMFPSSGLALGPDGDFYGTAYVGGTNAAPGYQFSNSLNGQGTVYKIAPSGAFTVLHYFNGADGGGPFAGLTLGSDGNFYGATTGGGARGEGTVFRITPTGELTTLYSFTDSASKPFPFGPATPLTLGGDGSFYGTSQVGANGDGAIFKITLTGTLTTLYSFNSSHVGPTGGLTLGRDGNFYGATTYVNGTNSAGVFTGYSTIFKVTTAGVLTTLYTGALTSSNSSNGLTGFAPSGGLSLGPDGNFYGTSQVGGLNNFGTIFRVTTTGTLTTLYSFSDTDGASPDALMLGADGNFYGMTSAGGSTNEGTVFRFDFGQSLPSINANGVVNGADYDAPVSPGSIASIFGNFSIPSPTSPNTLPVPTEISGTSIEFDTAILAPLFYGSQMQLTVQIPWELAGQTQATVSASQNGQSSATQTVPLAVYAPGIFVVNSQTKQGAILDTGYNLIGPTNPAKAGADVQIFCTGLGPVTNQPPTGKPALASPLSWTTATPNVTIEGVPATVLFSGLVPGAVGLYQVNVQVPSINGQSVPLAISVGGVISNTVSMAVE
jgi:uncharacterized protein (TIGR03437 family)